MRIKQIKSEGIAALSYFVSSGNEAMVIDPRRDALIYKQLADQAEAKITHIFETHRNEDYVTGSLELKALVTEAEIGHSNKTAFKFGVGLENEETFVIGDMIVRCLHTPGHTDDSICYAVADRAVGTNPIVVFTGDTLFVNEVGRTDLVDTSKHEQMSRKLHKSLHEVLLPIGDGVILYPAHGAGSVCGGNIGRREFSTIGFEKENNLWLEMDEDEFVKAKLHQHLTLASYFKHCEKLNTIGPPLVDNLPTPVELTIDEFHKLLMDENHRAIDIRSSASFLECYIPGSISLSLENMGLLAGWAFRPEQSFSIILHNGQHEFNEASKMLRRIGYDNIVGYLINGLEQWKANGRKTESIEEFSLDEFGAMQTRREVLVVDVREPHEFQEMRIEGSVSIPLTAINEASIDSLPKGPIVTICRSGARSTTAASILKRKGVDNLSAILHGLNGWISRDYPLEYD